MNPSTIFGTVALSRTVFRALSPRILARSVSLISNSMFCLRSKKSPALYLSPLVRCSSNSASLPHSSAIYVAVPVPMLTFKANPVAPPITDTSAPLSQNASCPIGTLPINLILSEGNSALLKHLVAKCTR